jgi:hypothetical protein
MLSVQEKFKELAVLVDKEEKDDADVEEEEEEEEEGGGDDSDSRPAEEEEKEDVPPEFDESPEDEARFSFIISSVTGMGFRSAMVTWDNCYETTGTGIFLPQKWFPGDLRNHGVTGSGRYRFSKCKISPVCIGNCISPPVGSFAGSNHN